MRVLLPILLALALAACDTAEERAENHYQRALALIAEGDRDRAAVELRNVFRLNGAHTAARLTYAGLLRDQGDVRGAFGQLLRAVEQDPRSVAGRRELAELALEAQDLEAAAEHAEAAFELAPADPEVRALKAAVDFRDPETRDAAVTAARAVVAEAPGIVPAHMVLIAERIAAGAAAEALALIDAGLAHAPEDEGLHLARLATLESLGDEAGAGTELKRMSTLFPDNAGVREALVQWHLRQGDPDGAEAVLRAVQPDPQAALTLVQFLLEHRGPDVARAELDRLAATAADPRPFRRARAGLDFAAGEHAAAIAELRALIDGAAPSDATRELQVGLAEMLAETGAAAESAALADAVLAADPAQVAALKLRARLAIDADRPEAAVQDMRAALAQAPRDPEAMTILALAHTRAGSRELAGEQLARAVEASGQPPEALRYARFLLQDGRVGPAEAVVADALRRDPHNRDLLEALGDIQLARGDWARAAQVAKRLRGQADPAARALGERLEVASLKAQGRTAEMTALLEELAGTDSAAMAELVRTQVAAGDLAGAQAYLDGVLARNSGSLPARLLQAGLAAAAGEPEAAAAAYRAVIADAPALAPAHRAYAAFLAAEGRPDAALAALDAGLAAAPDDAALMFAKAALQEATGDLAGALALYEALYARDSGSAVLANNLASLLTTVRDDPASLERAHRIARRLAGSDVPEFQDTYGWILHLQGDPAALESLAPAAAALPGNALVQFHHAEAAFALGRRDEARAGFEAALAAAAAGSPLPPDAAATAGARLAADR
jgi:tetratricopeptide (TPR) repeat protein